MSDNLHIIISGGGTGGHIFPALSIANAIKAYARMLRFSLSVQKAEWKCKGYQLQDIKS